MRYELTRVAPLRTAKIAGLVYGAVTAVIALILLPLVLVLLLATTRMSGPSDMAASILPIVLIFFYPLIGAVMGWIMGLVASAVYNLIVRWTGGLLLEFADRSAVQG